MVAHMKQPQPHIRESFQMMMRPLRRYVNACKTHMVYSHSRLACGPQTSIQLHPTSHTLPRQCAASKGGHGIAPPCAQVSMAAGKAGVAQQRQQEREAAAAKRAAAKARAEKRAAVAAEQKADRGSCRRFPYPCRM